MYVHISGKVFTLIATSSLNVVDGLLITYLQSYIRKAEDVS